MPAGSEFWPGVPYPWLPTPWIIDDIKLSPERVCLGVYCWNIRRLQFADAQAIVNVLQRRSAPLAKASLLAVALYRAGYNRQAEAIRDMYQGKHGVRAWQNQIRRVYNNRLVIP